MDNQHIAAIFQEIGDILEIQGENRFRVLAYHKAALVISELGQDLQDIYQEDPKKLLEIPGIGKDLAAKIQELLSTGQCAYYEKLVESFPRGLLELLRVRGVGPRKVKLFHSRLGIDSAEKLREAALAGQLRELPGMGEKSEKEILKALEDYDRHTMRMTLGDALYHAQRIIVFLQRCPDVAEVVYAGSLRRMKETIGDLDILVSVKNTKVNAIPSIMTYFTQYPEVTKVLAMGETKTSVLLHSGVQADLRVLPEKSFGAALHYFTGSKEHNVALRDRAKRMGFKVNEYGVFKGEEQVAGATEEEVFNILKLPYIPPLLRENRGEIEAAEQNRLPQIVTLKDLHGDLHVHSRWSDGTDEIEVIARAYRDAGFEYIALTDHSPAVAVARGLNSDRFALQWDEIDAINKELAEEAAKGAPPFTILKGVECDILHNGSLDLSDETLAQIDVVVASVHSRFNLSPLEQTKRVIKALQHPAVTILGHPSGRLINKREPYAIDMEEVINAAVAHRVALEINGQPLRLDLFDYYAKRAQEKKAYFSIDSDSHNPAQRNNLDFAVAVAQRGWVTPENVLNAWPLEKLREFLRK